jgi:2'-5' RNA ligase
MTTESALVVLIPEAESVIETFRKRYDPSAAVGLPAHVTLLYPFKSPDELTGDLSVTLRELFLQHPGFACSFTEIQRFPDMFYLAPVPARPFRQLTEVIFMHFPDTPPYGGAFAKIIPHLTIAQANDPQQFNEIAADFQLAARKLLPIHVWVNTVSLLEYSSGLWKLREQFPLGTAKQAS